MSDSDFPRSTPLHVESLHVESPQGESPQGESPQGESLQGESLQGESRHAVALRMAMLPVEALLVEAGFFSVLDVRFASSVLALADEAGEALWLALSLASRQTREGHVCATLGRFAGQHCLGADGKPVEGFCFPELEPWLEALDQSRLVSGGEAATPLVLEPPDRLYLYRYWQHETRLAEWVQKRRGPVEPRPELAAIRPSLERLFPTRSDELDGQRLAACVALSERLCIITGGPGTGKTTTVVRILALLAEEALSRGERPPRTVLLAPTGKAASRLAESIKASKRALSFAEPVQSAIAEEASTIHRALGRTAFAGTRFYHDSERPLLADIVLVDESSMVDVALMRRLFEAVPKRARLILLGDRHQLSSVEAGAVLGDLCASASAAGYSRALLERLGELPGPGAPSPGVERAVGLADAIVELKKSYRFDEHSGIGRLATAIREGDVKRTFEALDGADDVRWVEPTTGRSPLDQAGSQIADLAAQYLKQKDPLSALAALDGFRVLCAHRRGSAGVQAVNEWLEQRLSQRRLLKLDAKWYHGRPIIITENDYQLALYNGDVGLVWKDSKATRVFFLGEKGELRAFSPARLPPHETVFAMSIHKSQGSEFDEVAVVLPEQSSPLLTRELFYTAVTRAKKRALVVASAASLEIAVSRPVERASGLAERLA